MTAPTGLVRPTARLNPVLDIGVAVGSGCARIHLWSCSTGDPAVTHTSVHLEMATTVRDAHSCPTDRKFNRGGPTLASHCLKWVIR